MSYAMSNTPILIEDPCSSGSINTTPVEHQDGNSEAYKKKRVEKNCARKSIEQHSASIVEEENWQFLQQALNQPNKKPKRQVKLLPHVQVSFVFGWNVLCITTGI